MSATCWQHSQLGAPRCFPYTTMQVPKSWCTLNGNFHTEGRDKLELKFFEYSNSKSVSIHPDIVEYDKDKLKRPVFDLILVGTQTMDELSSTCRRRVADMSPTSPNVAKSWPTLRVVPTQKRPRHAQFMSITADKYKSVQTYELATLP